MLPLVSWFCKFLRLTIPGVGPRLGGEGEGEGDLPGPTPASGLPRPGKGPRAGTVGAGDAGRPWVAGAVPLGSTPGFKPGRGPRGVAARPRAGRGSGEGEGFTAGGGLEALLRPRLADRLLGSLAPSVRVTVLILSMT